MRVISGALRGRRLTAPRGMATRPTGDRIKESLFNILANHLRNRRVLDLFAGTGALGIEALSRGAVYAVFVDQAQPALSAIHRNLRDLGLEDRSRVIRWDIRSNLNFLRTLGQPMDLVFMDPPYETGAIAPTLHALVSSDQLAAGARIVVEHSLRETILLPIAHLTLTDQRRFGKTLVSFMDFMI